MKQNKKMAFNSKSRQKDVRKHEPWARLISVYSL